MSNETKQPTLPEAIALAREALNHAQNQTYPFGGLELFAKALAALDSLQVSEPSVSDSELAQRILTVLGYATEPSMEPGADERRDRIAEIIASNAAPCARCAEPQLWFDGKTLSEFHNDELFQFQEATGCSTAEEAKERIAALEAENARLNNRRADGYLYEIPITGGTYNTHYSPRKPIDVRCLNVREVFSNDAN